MSNEKASYEVKEDTGEVIEDNSYNYGRPGKIVFRTMYDNPYPDEGIDLSNEMEDIFIEVQPYAVDPETGKFLNDSSVPKIIPNGKVNVQERIQSFAKEVDLYSILEKFAYSDDVALINARQCGYGDISSIPNNINDIALMARASIDKLESMNPELAKMVLDSNVSAEAIQNRANEIYNSRVDSLKNNNNEEVSK